MHIQNFKLISLAGLLTIGFFTGCGGGTTNNSSSDTQKPKITLLGEKEIFIKKNENFTDPGATAIDDVDGLIPSTNITTSSTLNSAVAGTYTITYRVSDKAGNEDTAKRTVNVLDIITPTPQAGLHINEVLVANTETNYNPDTKQFTGWIELFNNSNSTINLNGYSLSDDGHSWNFPSQSIAAQAYQLVWLGDGSGLHTGFSLDMDGESITLKNGNTIVDDITFETQKSDISFTVNNGKLYYMSPTPASANSEATSLLVRTNKVDFSLSSGFYQEDQQVTLTSEDGGDIYYTKDGSTPTKSSQRYTAPLSISTSTVLKTRALASNRFMSSVKSRTYLINEQTTLPVISLGVDERYLIDPKIGIYVLGTDINGNPNQLNFDDPNYMQDWVRTASIEYIKENKSQFNENVGIKIHGAGSRTFEQKSLTVYARDRFGPKSINYQLFADKNIKKFKTFLLRNAGGDHQDTMMRDALNQSIVKDDLDLDYQAYQPSVVFVNGKYWGIFNIRETTNDDYLEGNHNVDPKNIDILYNNNIVLKGSVDAYTSTQNLIENSDFTYEQVAQVLDIPAYIDYLISEIYVGNIDWPGRNRKYWREKKADAKWRYFFYDLDLTLQDVTHNTLEFALGEATAPGDYNRPYSTTMIIKLMNNPQFRNEFTSKFTTCLNSTFLPSKVDSVITSIKNTIEPEIARHFTRWTPGDNSSWSSKVDYYYTYYNARNTIMSNYLNTRFNLSGEHTLNISANTNGQVTLDGITLTQAFTGTYFSGAKVTLAANAKEGYQFKRWLIDGIPNDNQTIIRDITQGMTIQAEFEPYNGPNIVINEINFKSEKSFDTGDWIELYNNTNSQVNLSGWQIQDSSDTLFTFAQGTSIEAGAFLVIAQESQAMKSLIPNSAPTGDLPFGISSKGESLRLWTNNHTLVDNVTFDTTWTETADKGDTLTLNDPNSDNSDPNNWSISTGHGTPGF